LTSSASLKFSLSKLQFWVIAALFMVNIYSLFIQQVLACLIITLSLIDLARNNFSIESQSLSNNLSLTFILFFVFRVAGAFLNQDIAIGIRNLQFPFFSLIFLCLCRWQSFISNEEANVLKRLWIIAAAIACVIAIIKFGTGIESRVGGPFGNIFGKHIYPANGNYSTFGEFTAITLLFFCLPQFGLETLKISKLIIFNSILILGGLILTFNRSSFLAVGLPSAHSLARGSKAMLIIILLLCIGIIAFIPHSRESALSDSKSADVSTGRIELWKIAYEHILDHPILGNGLGSFKSIVTAQEISGLPDKGVGDWHNQYIQLYMESGLVGIGLFGSLLFQSLRSFFSLRLNTNSNDKRLIGWGGIYLIAGIMILSCFEVFLSSPSSNIVFWCVLGYGIGWLDVKEEMSHV
jgi:O-antigen ligase